MYIISIIRIKLAVWVKICNRVGDSPNLLLEFVEFYRYTCFEPIEGSILTRQLVLRYAEWDFFLLTFSFQYFPHFNLQQPHTIIGKSNIIFKTLVFLPRSAFFYVMERCTSQILSNFYVDPLESPFFLLGRNEATCALRVSQLDRWIWSVTKPLF